MPARRVPVMPTTDVPGAGNQERTPSTASAAGRDRGRAAIDGMALAPVLLPSCGSNRRPCCSRWAAWTPSSAPSPEALGGMIQHNQEVVQIGRVGERARVIVARSQERATERRRRGFRDLHDSAFGAGAHSCRLRPGGEICDQCRGQAVFPGGEGGVRGAASLVGDRASSSMAASAGPAATSPRSGTRRTDFTARKACWSVPISGDHAPALRFTAMTPAERRAAAIADGERLHPGYEKLVGPAASIAWAKFPTRWAPGSSGTPFQERGKRNTRPCSPATDRFTSPESI